MYMCGIAVMELQVIMVFVNSMFVCTCISSYHVAVNDCMCVAAQQTNLKRC